MCYFEVFSLQLLSWMANSSLGLHGRCFSWTVILQGWKMDLCMATHQKFSSFPSWNLVSLSTSDIFGINEWDSKLKSKVNFSTAFPLVLHFPVRIEMLNFLGAGKPRPGETKSLGWRKTPAGRLRTNNKWYKVKESTSGLYGASRAFSGLLHEKYVPYKLN